MRQTDRLLGFLAALSVLRLYTPRTILFFSVWGLGYALNNMILHPIHSVKPIDPLHPAWTKDVQQLRLDKQYDKALELVNQHLKQDPNSYEGYVERSLIFASMGFQFSLTKQDSP